MLSVSRDKVVPSSLTADKPSSRIYGACAMETRNRSTEKLGLDDGIDNDNEQRGDCQACGAMRGIT